MINEQGFVQSLPDVASRTTVDGRIAITTYIYIREVTFLDFERTLLDRQQVYPALMECHTGL